MAVDGGGPDRHVGMDAVKAARCPRARRAGRRSGCPWRRAPSAGRWRRRPNSPSPASGSSTMHQAVGEVGRRLEVVFDRLQRLGIAVEADMGDAGRGHEVQHAVEQADAGAQDRREDELLAGDLRRLIVVSGVSISTSLERQVARHLVARAACRSRSGAGGSPWSSASLSRISVSLCCTSGWSTTVTPLACPASTSMAGLAHCTRVRTRSEHRPIADHGERRRAIRASRAGEAPARRPGAAFEHLGERQIPLRRRRAWPG